MGALKFSACAGVVVVLCFMAVSNVQCDSMKPFESSVDLVKEFFNIPTVNTDGSSSEVKDTKGGSEVEEKLISKRRSDEVYYDDYYSDSQEFSTSMAQRNPKKIQRASSIESNAMKKRNREISRRVDEHEEEEKLQEIIDMWSTSDKNTQNLFKQGLEELLLSPETNKRALRQSMDNLLNLISLPRGEKTQQTKPHIHPQSNQHAAAASQPAPPRIPQTHPVTQTSSKPVNPQHSTEPQQTTAKPNAWEEFMERLRKNFNDPTNNDDFRLFSPSKLSEKSESEVKQELKDFLTRETVAEDEADYESLGSSSIIWKLMKKMWELNLYLMKLTPMGNYLSKRPSSNSIEEQIIHDILFKPWEEFKRLKGGLKEIYWTKFRDLASLKLGKQFTPLYTKKTKKSPKSTTSSAIKIPSSVGSISSSNPQQTLLPIVVKDSSPTQNQFYLTSASNPAPAWHSHIGKSISHVTGYSPKASLISALIQLKWVLLKEKALAIIKLKTETIPALVKLKIKLLKKIVWLLTHKSEYFPLKLIKVIAHAKWKKAQTFVNKILQLNEHLKSWKGFGWTETEESTPTPVASHGYGWKSSSNSESSNALGSSDAHKSVFSSLLSSMDISSVGQSSNQGYQQAPQPPQQEYNAPQPIPSQTYGVPETPAPTYGVPQHPNQVYQAPSPTPGYQVTPSPAPGYHPTPQSPHQGSSTPYQYLTTPTAQTYNQGGSGGDFGDFNSAVGNHQYYQQQQISSSTASPSHSHHIKINPELIQLSQEEPVSHFHNKKVPVLLYGQHKRTDQEPNDSKLSVKFSLPYHLKSKESERKEKNLFRHKLLEIAMKTTD